MQRGCILFKSHWKTGFETLILAHEQLVQLIDRSDTFDPIVLDRPISIVRML